MQQRKLIKHHLTRGAKRPNIVEVTNVVCLNVSAAALVKRKRKRPFLNFQ